MLRTRAGRYARSIALLLLLLAPLAGRQNKAQAAGEPYGGIPSAF